MNDTFFSYLLFFVNNYLSINLSIINYPGQYFNLSLEYTIFQSLQNYRLLYDSPKKKKKKNKEFLNKEGIELFR